jgi:hypothetical protein
MCSMSVFEFDPSEEPPGTGTVIFGEPWKANMCEGATVVPTPVGQPCLHCDEPIDDGDQGVIHTTLFLHGNDGEPVAEPVHRECDMRAVLGSIGHLTMRCPCEGGDYDDPPGMTRREAALLVKAWVDEHGPGPVRVDRSVPPG